MSRRNRRVVPPIRPTIRRKDKDVLPFHDVLGMLKTYDLTQNDIHELLDWIYLRYEGEYRYYNRLKTDEGKMIV